jgi:hypothetical protein
VLTNATAANVRIDRVDVLDAGTQQVLQSVGGPQLSASSNLIGGPIGDEGTADPTTPATTVPGSSAAVVWLDVPLTGKTPASLVHRVAAVIVGPTGETPVESTVSRIATSTAPAVMLGPPVRGGQSYASDGCCADDTITAGASSRSTGSSWSPNASPSTGSGSTTSTGP